MALNSFKCNYLTSLHFKGLNMFKTLALGNEKTHKEHKLRPQPTTHADAKTSCPFAIHLCPLAMTAIMINIKHFC